VEKWTILPADNLVTADGKHHCGKTHTIKPMIKNKLYLQSKLTLMLRRDSKQEHS